MPVSSSTYERWLRQHVNADPRILKVQVERAAAAIRSAVYDAPVWAAAAALLCSDAVHVFGNVPLSRCFAFVALIALSSVARYVTLKRFYAWQHEVNSPQSALRWAQYFLGLQACVSVVWGLNSWLLWDHGSAVNHVFLCLVSLAVVTRFLVTRAGQYELFVVSLAPVTLLLLARYATDLSVIGVILGILSLAYTVRLVYDSRKLSERAFSDAHLRFANEDMARDLEEARDEALKKRFEAETANASKTAFLANMSHELRTPLNAILGFSEIIGQECLGPVGNVRYKEYAGDIHSSGVHLLSLINDLLDVAKIEAGRMEIEPHMIETRHALESSLKLVASKTRERKQTLTIDVDEDAGVLYADERALKQIAINLVSNSVKFTANGGHIGVHARRMANGDFELVVEDNGAGIPKEKMGHIFMAFSQIDNRYDRQSGGTGLGLALVRGLAELHGGRVWVESEEGKGTSVHVVLPAQQDAAKQAVA
jgi:two-component system, cell cycle sensor histidine kinase PleC